MVGVLAEILGQTKVWWENFGAVRRGGGTWWSYRGTNAEVCKIRIWRMDGRREVGGTAVAGRRGVDRLQRTARAAFAPRNGCRVASRSQFRRDAPSRIVRGGGGATVKTALGWPVFPSGTRMKIYFLARGGVGVCRDRPLVARVVELVDTQVSEACAVRCSGSSPLPGTIPLFER